MHDVGPVGTAGGGGQSLHRLARPGQHDQHARRIHPVDPQEIQRRGDGRVVGPGCLRWTLQDRRRHPRGGPVSSQVKARIPARPRPLQGSVRAGGAAGRGKHGVIRSRRTHSAGRKRIRVRRGHLRAQRACSAAASLGRCPDTRPSAMTCWRQTDCMVRSRRDPAMVARSRRSAALRPSGRVRQPAARWLRTRRYIRCRRAAAARSAMPNPALDRDRERPPVAAKAMSAPHDLVRRRARRPV